MKTFVTGGTGYIGRRLLRFLQEQGHEVHALVRSNGSKLPPGVHPVLGDILTPGLSRDFPKICDQVFHLAGLVSFRQEMRQKLIHVNESGTRNVLDAVAAWPEARVVVTSSACTIGIARQAGQHLDEAAPADPEQARRNPYLESKLHTEVACLEAAKRGQHVVVVNPTTVYGPGDDTLNSGALIKAVMTSPAVPVPPGGSNVIDIADLVAGMLAAARYGQRGERYILGGWNLTFADIVKTVITVADIQPVLLPIPSWLAPPAGLAASFLGRFGAGRFLTPQIVEDLFGFKHYSSAKAERVLHWKAARPFPETVTGAIAYYRQQGLIP